MHTKVALRRSGVVEKGVGGMDQNAEEEHKVSDKRGGASEIPPQNLVIILYMSSNRNSMNQRKNTSWRGGGDYLEFLLYYFLLH